MGRRRVGARVFNDIYHVLYQHFGPQNWWPAETRFEVIVGAILTQNTNWQNVERAIANLKKHGFLTAKKLRKLKRTKLAQLIKPAGYYNIKADRLKCFVDFFIQRYQGSLKKMFGRRLDLLREELLSIKGIGPETADNILLYAGGKPIFVIDAYTRRVLSRHRLVKEKAHYEDIQDLFHKFLPRRVRLFNEYHALLVKLAKIHCHKKPDCRLCPVGRLGI